MDKDDGFGTPQVVGVQNLTNQYREDKRLRVHETPFELRYPPNASLPAIMLNTLTPKAIKAFRIGYLFACLLFLFPFFFPFFFFLFHSIFLILLHFSMYVLET
jgi:hypothetical protein